MASTFIVHTAAARGVWVITAGTVPVSAAAYQKRAQGFMRASEESSRESLEILFRQSADSRANAGAGMHDEHVLLDLPLWRVQWT
eukprot:CAMPEP_0119329470 /NCGR_PEP_ID=MMETSP1333-20130426/75940_1 /TAXON_ID=418940 /ORGANISM="Scyphosphaera apsteinii, Strain RCC1455" /LENGTH=84 /DNA_ID=CAMNT_0007338597 /DNA_START=167 /DNA_END=418 /DNA_ORIENTATION=+